MHSYCHKIACLRPMLGYVAGLLMGVASLQLALSCFLFAVWFFWVYRLVSNRSDSLWSIRWMSGVMVLSCWLGLGLLAGEWSRRETDMPDGFGQGAAFNALVDVTVLPQERKKTWKLGVCVRKTSEEAWCHRKLLVYLPKEIGVENLKMGDCLWMVINPALPDDGGFDGFDYAKWLRHKGYTATAFVKKWKPVSKANPWNIRAIGAQLQESLVSVFRQTGLPEESMILVSAMTLGARESLSGELNLDFARAGVSHILSVSGLHVGMVFALLRLSLFFMGYSQRMRRLRDVLIVACLWLFALVTGLSPAVCRAVLMATMLVVGGLLGRNTSALNTVLFTAWLQLLFNPLLLYDVGFQLSYCAVIGLVLFVPLLKTLWQPSSLILRYVWGLLSMSLAAQLITSPLTIHYFGQFPLYFLVSNILAVPLSGVIMYIAVACLLTAPISFLFIPLSACLSVCARLFLNCVQGVAELPGSVLTGLTLSTYQVVAVYVLMGTLLAWVMGRRTVFLRLCLLCLLFFQCCYLWDKIVGN